MKNHFSWKSTGKMFPQALTWGEEGYGGSNRIRIRMMFDAERKELTDEFPLIIISNIL
jgi:hypothetical protein